MLRPGRLRARARRRRRRLRRRQHLRVHRAGPAGVVRRHPRDARPEGRRARSGPSSSPAAWPSGRRTTAARRRARDRSARRRVRPRGDHQGRRPAARRACTSSGRVFRPAPVRALAERARLRITPRHFAYLKISEGCDRLCTFCAIPKMRGKHVTKPIEEVVAEARELAADGVRELIIVAQDTTYYGMDLYGEPRLAELLRELDKVEGIDWIRLLYFYPIYFTDELIDDARRSEEDRAVPRHAAAAHQRPRCSSGCSGGVNRAETEDAARQAARRRSRAWRCGRRSSSAFPARRTREFEELVRLRRRHRFERVGVFTYSLEPDTPAARLDGHLPEDVKQARRDRLMTMQQEVAFDWSGGRSAGRSRRSSTARTRRCQPRPGPRPRRRPGDRRPGPGEGQEPAAGRHRAGQGDGGRRLRPRGADRLATLVRTGHVGGSAAQRPQRPDGRPHPADRPPVSS